jgi:hypothetical protein
VFDCRPIWRGVSKGVEDSRRPSTLRAGYLKNGCKAVSRVERLQGLEGSGRAGPGETCNIHMSTSQSTKIKENQGS